MLKLFALFAAAGTLAASTFGTSANCLGSSQSVTSSTPTYAGCVGIFAGAESSSSLGHASASASTYPPRGASNEGASAGAGWSGDYLLTITGGTGPGLWQPAVSFHLHQDSSDSASVYANVGPFRMSFDNTANSVNVYGCEWRIFVAACAKPFTYGEPISIQVDIGAYVSSYLARLSTGSASIDLTGISAGGVSGAGWGPATFQLTEIPAAPAPTPLPEPSTLAMVGIGLALVVRRSLRRRNDPRRPGH